MSTPRNTEHPLTEDGGGAEGTLTPHRLLDVEQGAAAAAEQPVAADPASRPPSSSSSSSTNSGSTDGSGTRSSADAPVARVFVVAHSDGGDDASEWDVEAGGAQLKGKQPAPAAASPPAASAPAVISKRRRALLLAASVAAVLLFDLALGVGLGLGLQQLRHRSSSGLRGGGAAAGSAAAGHVAGTALPSATGGAPSCMRRGGDPLAQAGGAPRQYDLCDVLGKSLLFYEAQRSGNLPASNRIPWRGDSGLTHRAPGDGRDVTGGWHDAGDHVKFNLPMAWSANTLAWSLVDFADGYRAAGQYEAALDSVRWATDYFIKCIGDGTSSIVVQVGNGGQDHIRWRRPEDVPDDEPVPVYVVTPDKPGSDVVGAMGAALAAASVAFQAAAPAYSQQLLDASVKAYRFASSHTGLYTAAVPDAASFYPSSNWKDDVALNALWLYIRTGEARYRAEGLATFMEFYNSDGSGVWNLWDWDSASWSAAVLLARLFPDDPVFPARLEKFTTAWLQGVDGVTYTPKGLAFSGPWGSLRHAANAAFLMKAYAAGRPAMPVSQRRAIDCFVRQQLGYALGDTGRSFVVGFGVSPPTRPHHRAATCPTPRPGAPACSWADYEAPGPNAHVLTGALVGGPGAADDYEDRRSDFVKNEVAVDYNAGFTGALAAAVQDLQC